jgi:hypothetical protein
MAAMKRYLLLLLLAGPLQAAEPEASDPVSVAVANCESFNTRFVDTYCAATKQKSGAYRVEIRAGTPDAMRVVFMRSLAVADLICNAGHKVELVQQLKDANGTNTVRWAINPKECGITRLPG